MEDLITNFPNMETQDLLDCAIITYTEKFPDCQTYVSKFWQRRMGVNYLRHHFSNYNNLVSKTRTSKEDLFYFENVMNIIIDKYPDLTEECNKQIKNKKIKYNMV